MIRAIGLGLVALSFGMPEVAWASQPAQPKKRPNVIFILTDDLGYGDLGCQGNTKVKTPHIDKLARQGMRFTQFYVTSPVCTPSRASFLTGKHPQRFGIHHADLPETEPRYPLPDNVVSLQRLLRQAGYFTAHIGKWHLGEPPLTGLPRRHGFDFFFGCMGGRPSSSWNKFARYDDAQYFRNEEPAKTYPGYNTDVLTDQTLELLDGIAKKEQPFYLNLWYHAPHEPLSPKVKEAEHYRDLPPHEQVYFGTITNLDNNIGRLLKKLDDLGIADDTIVIFSSDNGPEVLGKRPAAGSAGPLRGKKTQLWEGGVRVPFIVRWNGHIPAGKTSNEVASALDLIHTITELTGTKHPNVKSLDEGMSLTPVLLGKGKLPQRTLYWEFHGKQRGGPDSGSLAIRDGDWKLYLYPGTDKRMLFNLADDIGEQTDQAAARKEIADALQKKALAWYADLPRETAKKMANPVPKTELEANTLPREKEAPKQQQQSRRQEKSEWRLLISIDRSRILEFHSLLVISGAHYLDRQIAAM